MEYVQIGQFFAAFALVVGLIGLLGIALRKYGNPAMRIRRKSEARLSIVETLPIDARSRLLLVRRDDMEHLIVKSGDRFEVIEVDIPCNDEEEDTGPSLIISNKERLAHASE
ncbi:MAG: flagellar biosynthetic protein FliO [Alphaproteobacteria bacterium]|nr:flagellar biosynthetic protein FliO [Alphaproteobacteria bacterium]